MTLDIAPMTRAELDLALDWAAAEGWNPGLDDAAAFHAADPEGFLMGRVAGEPAACISVVRHAPAFGFLGLYLCRPEWRGRGHGWAVWQAGLARLGDRTVGLDGVAGQQENYRRSGFRPMGRTIRHQGDFAGGPPPRDGSLVPAAARRGEIAALDRRATGVDRPAFLAAWLSDGPSRRSLALIRDGGVAGYGTVRRCRAGVKVGPLIAAAAAEAEALLGALAGIFPGRPSPSTCPKAIPARRLWPAPMGSHRPSRPRACTAARPRRATRRWSGAWRRWSWDRAAARSGRSGIRFRPLSGPEVLSVAGRRMGRTGWLAERQGFEPWVESPPQRFSRPPRSTAPASLR